MTVAVGSSPLAEQFFAGNYGDLLAQSYDAAYAIADHDVAFVVGALTFLDRVDEAHAMFDGYLSRNGREPRTLVAARFFLGLAAARAGYFDRASELLVREGFRWRHHPDRWVRALVFQGLACQCYFTGRFARAARHALRALQAAHEAKFLYAAMLGTDIRGHSLVQIGQLQRGIALLEQANQQAMRLGLVHNAFAVDTSIATYVTKFDPHAAALGRVEALLRRRAHDSYSRRALLIEAAVQRALRGRRSAAIEALDAAHRDALRSDTRRGRVASLLARLWVMRWQHGPGACGELLAEASALVEPRDVAFRAQLLGFEVLVARASADQVAEASALAELRALARSSQHFLARAALGQYDRAERTTAFDEDGLTPLLRAVAHRDVSALSRIVSLGLLGAIPELLGLAPGRRIILIPGEDLLLLEDHGDVVVRHRPPRWCPALLRVLASGDATKERIVAGLWGLRVYHPEIHDPPVRTTIHRLRSFLAPHSSWIEASDGGYRVTVPVHLVAPPEQAPLPVDVPLWEEGHVPPLEPHHYDVHTDTASAGRTDVTHRVLRRLEELESARVPDLARSLELSPSTVLRALRALVAERRVERFGFARATRYRPRA
ncbi:MAG: hypothetical protein AB7P03_14465 [Kofleriaceae bacterium]